MAYQDIFKKIKDNILIDKKIQIYRLHYNYLKTCLKYPIEFPVDKSKYSEWDLDKVKTMPFDKWWKLKGMKLLGKKLDTVREIKTSSFNSRPNTIVFEVPTNVPIQFSLKQIKDILKTKSVRDSKDDEKSHYLKLEIYLKTWNLKRVERLTAREIRRRLVAERKIILKKRGLRSAMDRTATEKFLKFDGKAHNLTHLERQISRYKTNAQKILLNVCKGKFPGKYAS